MLSGLKTSVQSEKVTFLFLGIGSLKTLGGVLNALGDAGGDLSRFLGSQSRPGVVIRSGDDLLSGVLSLG